MFGQNFVAKTTTCCRLRLANLHDGKIPTYFWRQRHSIRDWLIRNLNRVGHFLQQRIGGARLTKDLMSGFKHSIQLIDLRLSCPSKPNRFRIELCYLCKKLSPIHSWHSQIRQHHLRWSFGHRFKGFGRLFKKQQFAIAKFATQLPARTRKYIKLLLQSKRLANKRGRSSLFPF